MAPKTSFRALTLTAMVASSILLPALSSNSPLLLSPMIQSGNVKKARSDSRVDHMLDMTLPKSYAGYITVNDLKANHLFFWYFPSKRNDAPLLIWMNGVAGTSAMVGLLWDHGPLKFNRSVIGTPTRWPRMNSWVGQFAVVYLDAPVGTGYSFSGNGDAGMSVNAAIYTEELFSFTAQFLKLFPEKADHGVYLGGNDFGGKMSIHLARRMSISEHAASLRGLVLEAPMISPQVQYLRFHDYLYSMGYESFGAFTTHQTVIKDLFAKAAIGQFPTGSQIRRAVAPADTELENFQNYATNEVVDSDGIKRVMESSSLRRHLHVDRQQPFEVFNTRVNDFLGPDTMLPAINELAEILLASKYKVLLFSGDDDAYLGVEGVEAALISHQWAHQAGYATAKRTPWGVSSSLGRKREVGYFVKAGPLCRVIFKSTGHYAPHEKSREALNMVRNFLEHGCLRE